MGQRIHSKLERSHFERRAAEQGRGFDPANPTPPFPANGLVEVTNSCNHSCVFCTNPRMQRRQRVLSLETYTRFIGQARSLGLEEVGLYATGEPFAVKNLVDYVKIAADAGVGYIYITTNGALAVPDRARAVIDAGVSSIKFSINAGSPESYRLVHGKDDFDTVLENLEFIAQYRTERAPGLRLLASCVVTRFIEHEVESLRRRLMQSVDELMLIGVGPQAGQSASYIGELSSSLSEPHDASSEVAPACGLLWNRVHLTAEGYLSLCCVDYENALTYADLNHTTLAEAWHNETIRKMRLRHQTQELSGTLCRSCLYRTEETIRPISAVGHSDPALPLLSNNPRGLRSVASRIEELKRRDSEREPAGTS